MVNINWPCGAELVKTTDALHKMVIKVEAIPIFAAKAKTYVMICIIMNMYMSSIFPISKTIVYQVNPHYIFPSSVNAKLMRIKLMRINLMRIIF